MKSKRIKKIERGQEIMPGFESSIRAWIRYGIRNEPQCDTDVDRERFFKKLFDGVPSVLLPRDLWAILYRYWFIPIARDELKDSGWVFPEGNRGTRVKQLKNMTLDEVKLHALELLISAGNDVGAARRVLESWAAMYPEQEIDVDATWRMWVAEANLLKRFVA